MSLTALRNRVIKPIDVSGNLVAWMTLYAGILLVIAAICWVYVSLAVAGVVIDFEINELRHSINDLSWEMNQYYGTEIEVLPDVDPSFWIVIVSTIIATLFSLAALTLLTYASLIWWQYIECKRGRIY